jgi:large subunit ribosomal protein L22
MAESKTRARFLHIAPRKARLVADLIRGKQVSEARTILEFTIKRSAPMISKLLESAVANVESAAKERRERIDTDAMIVKEIYVDGGPTLRRFAQQPRGRATRIRKRTSHVTIAITDKRD